MFLTRILFNTVLMLQCMANRALLGSDVPIYGLTGALLLHVGWFKGGLGGYLKRRRIVGARKAGMTLPVIEAKDADVSAMGTEGEAMDKAVETEQAGPGTPDDSPLLTPYTPSQTPMTLRDSYLFPSIPSIPSIPALSLASISSMKSIPAIPAFAFPSDLGFKEAVKGRWEEQRGRFEDLGISMRGRGREAFGGLGLGSIGLRRRGMGGGQSRTVDGEGNGDGDEVRAEGVNIDFSGRARGERGGR